MAVLESSDRAASGSECECIVADVLRTNEDKQRAARKGKRSIEAAPTFQTKTATQTREPASYK